MSLGQKSMQRMGTNGTRGVRKDRGASGSVLRRMTTVMAMMKNVDRVPTLTSCTMMSSGRKPAISAVAEPVIQLNIEVNSESLMK